MVCLSLSILEVQNRIKQALIISVFHKTTCSVRCGMQQAMPRKRQRQLRLTSAALGISKSVDILHHVRSLPTAEEQLEASNRIKAIEREAMQHQEPQPGLVELMEYLRDKGIKRALCTRNFEYVILPFFLPIFSTGDKT